jgi:hypothetical protein
MVAGRIIFLSRCVSANVNALSRQKLVSCLRNDAALPRNSICDRHDAPFGELLAAPKDEEIGVVGSRRASCRSAADPEEASVAPSSI